LMSGGYMTRVFTTAKILPHVAENEGRQLLFR